MKTIKDSIYSYADTDKKKKYAYRYKFYDAANKRIEKTKQGFRRYTKLDVSQTLPIYLDILM